jgi:hypothetical protein
MAGAYLRLDGPPPGPAMVDLGLKEKTNGRETPVCEVL